MKANTNKISDLAEILKVSPTTISRVLSGKSEQYRISKKTSEKVLELAKELHFSPNQIASGLRLKRTHTIGLIIPDISNPFFAIMARKIVSEAGKKGFTITLIDSNDQTEKEIQALQLLRSKKADGIILFPVGKSHEHIENIYKTKYPLVIIDRIFPNLNIPYVAANNYQGAFDAVEHLISMGHSNIACIQGNIDTWTNHERIKGYNNALAKNNIPIKKKYIFGSDYGFHNGYESMNQILKLSKKPTAIFTTSNLISLGALKAISEAKLKAPDDFSIISFDEQPYLDLLATPMSTVKQPQLEMGKKAVEHVCKMIASDMTLIPESIILPTKLVIRKSVNNLLK